jgi:phosphoribosylformylglycinamidine cyclo-ligase
MDNSRYGKRGVSASKSEVHDAIKKMDKGLFPTAFCKILPDLVANDDAYCNIMHADTAGTKTSLAYIYWKETQDLSVWKGVVQDSIVMNIDDMACVGSIDNIILSSTVGRNKSVIPSDVLKEVIGGTSFFIEKMLENDVRLTLAGGETADVGDIVRTIDVGITAFSRLKKSELVINQIRGGDVIVGLASDGIATYESEYNGGMGSNGLTSARHDVFDHIYRDKYPESYDPAIDKSLVYCGSRTLTESIKVPGFGQTTIGKLVLSPTRTYIPVIKKVLSKYRARINGLIHCTGGAQTKVMKFVNGVRIVKNKLMPIPTLFQLIESESGTNRREMYEVFNMGHRLEFYTDEVTAQHIIDISKSFNINAQIIGHVEASRVNELIISDNLGEYTY